jgi:stage V sporulation protein S
MESNYDDFGLEREREAGASGFQTERGARNVGGPPRTPATGAAGMAPQSSAEVLKVSTRSRPSAVAGAIAGVIRESGVAEVQSIGAGATNQAIKAIAIARSYLNEEGLDIVCAPSFIDVAIDEEERTAIRMLIQRRDQLT